MSQPDLINNRYCYMVGEEAMGNNRSVDLVVENDPLIYKTGFLVAAPKASEFVKKYNDKLGLDDDDVAQVIGSSIAKSIQASGL